MKFTIEDQKLELDISLSKSSLLIQESEGDEVELECTGLRRKTAEEIFSIAFRNNRLLIKEKNPNHSPVFASLFNATAEGEVVVKIPRQTLISGKAKTVKGTIKTGKINFTGELRSVMGKVSVKEIITDGLEIQNIGGGIFVGKLDGFFNGKTVAGEITVEGGRFLEVKVSSISGDVRLSGDFELEADSDISTVSGSVYLDVKKYKEGKELLISTLSGNTSIVGQYPEDWITIKPKMPFFKNHPFKNFGPSMKDMCSSFFAFSHKSDNDSSSEAETEVEVEVESQPDSKESTKMILQMLSEGKISVEEAERLIKALSGK